jgi:TolA-binding protein
MRHAVLASSALSLLLSLVSVAHAQSVPIETRVDRLEKEVRAVQRKVFPGGTPIEAEIRSQPTAPAQVGTPASTPISDLISRVDALEGQLASLTGQTEQNAYKIKQLEDAFAKYKSDMAAAASGPPPLTPTTSTPSASAPPKVATPTPAPAPSNDARKTAVAVIEKPETGDAAADAYTYGFRLWDAKFYPEAQAQLKAALDKYASTNFASRISNLLGRAYLDDGKPALASVAFYDNYQKRPKGDRAADSLTWLGEALIQLKKPADACKVYSQLDQDYGATLSATLKGMAEKGKTRAKCGA